MASKQQRVIAFTLAMLFLATTVGTGALVIWQMREENKNKESAQLSPQDTSDLAQQINQPNEQTEKPNMLKGIKLAEFTATSEASELQKIDLIEGAGETVQPNATITAHYTGAYASNGEIFESSLDSGQPAKFPLNGVIQGWTIGVPGMKVGGKRRLIIPGTQAYGVAPEGYTPGSTERPLGTLVFDIELVSIGE